ncbi:MAG: ribosomal protein S18-alanine N-acetyltransferase [Acidobacteriota bacterium]|jgi:ribosomal-protein-alanine N-acetyltransferase|nr:ribosomal protein S18-alanine N-acetyltransferase [Acidobacteriota bacterium]
MNAQDKIDSDNISINSMTEQDINDVLEIQNESNLSRWKYIDYKREIENKDSIKLAAKFCDKKVIGFAVIRLLSDSYKSETIYSSSEIYNIAVSKSFQSKGIGQKIFDEIIIELRKQNVLEIWLEVRESNAKAIKFYKRNGFVKHSVRKNYYKNPLETAHILRLLLNYENQT